MDFPLPELGEGIYEAELVEWRVKPGDSVTRGQTLAEVLTDKATIDLPSPFTGAITELQAEPGSKIKVGQSILKYDAGKSESASAAKHDAVPSEKGNGRDSARSKSASPTTAERAEAEAAPQKAATPTRSTIPATTSASTTAIPSGEDVRVRAGPAVRRMATLLGVDLAQVEGSGPGGRILIDDIETAAEAIRDRPQISDEHLASASNAAAGRTSSSRPALGRGPELKPGSRIKFMGIRRKIAEHMVESKRTIPHFGYVDECNVTDLVRLRASLSQTDAAPGVKLTYLPWFVKAAVAALKEVPLVNASLDEQAEEIVLHSRYDIGIAMATAEGLIVPVVHDADRKSLVEIAREIQSLTNTARQGKLSLNQLRGGTFTISSIGSIGGLTSTPIIHQPQVGILAIGRIVKRPIYDAEGKVHPADMVYLSYSFDHRVVDGAVGAEFSNALIRELENPARLLIHE